MYYSRDGKPITAEEWSRGFSSFDRRVAETTLPDGKWISTVYLGLDHRFSDDGPPLIFETMAFASQSDMDELDCERYPTEAKAIEGHAKMVERYGV